MPFAARRFSWLMVTPLVSIIIANAVNAQAKGRDTALEFTLELIRSGKGR